MNKILGIVGRQGSGKSTLARMLEVQSDYVYIDIDQYVKRLYENPEIINPLVDHFGESIKVFNPALQRYVINTKALGKIVFSSPDELNWLNLFIYPIIKKNVLDFVKTQKNKLIIIDWALLTETDLVDECDLIWQLNIPYEIRKQRVMERDGITEEYFDLRESRAPKLEYSCRCDILEFNSVEEVEDLKYAIAHGARVRI